MTNHAQNVARNGRPVDRVVPVKSGALEPGGPGEGGGVAPADSRQVPRLEIIIQTTIQQTIKDKALELRFTN